MPLLEVKNLHVTVDGKQILNGLDLAVSKGEVHAIMGPNGSGKSTLAYVMEYVDSVGPTDEVVEDKGVKLLIDPKAVLFLLGTEMDWKVDKLSSQFVFNNPNQTSACGCGESVLLTPAKAEGSEAH